jgi:hypothetical protein
MAIIFYRENRENDEIIYKPTPAPIPEPTPEPPLIPMPEPTPTPTPTPLPDLPVMTTQPPEKQRYFELLNEYETLKQELLKCYGFPIPEPFLTRLLKAEEVDYEELNEKLRIEIIKLKQQIEQCKSRQQPSGGGATTPSPETPEPKKAGFPAWLLIFGLALIILLPKQNKEQR